MSTTIAPETMPSRETASADPLPTKPTVADFRRLGAIVTMARYRIDPVCLWKQEDVAMKLWECKELMPFPSLASVAMGLARDPRIKTSGSIGLYIAGVIEL